MPHHAALLKDVPVIEPVADPCAEGRGGRTFGHRTSVLSEKSYDRIVAWMRARVGERITEDMLRALSPLGRNAFRRAFEAHAGMSPMCFLTWMRVDMAVRLLIDTRFDLGEIAFVTGLENKQTLADTFLGTLGVRPQALRLSSV